MKYADVKAQKKNYLVFSLTVSIGQNFHVTLLPGLSFSNLPAQHPNIAKKVNQSRVPPAIHRYFTALWTYLLSYSYSHSP